MKKEIKVDAVKDDSLPNFQHEELMVTLWKNSMADKLRKRSALIEQNKLIRRRGGI